MRRPLISGNGTAISSQAHLPQRCVAVRYRVNLYEPIQVRNWCIYIPSELLLRNSISRQLTENGISRTSTSTVGVYVEPGELIAVLAGGSDRNLPFNDTLTIDASGSYDRDVPDYVGVDANLTFSGPACS